MTLFQSKNHEPWLWQLRSSQSFVVFVVSLAMLTVSTPFEQQWDSS